MLEVGSEFSFSTKYLCEKDTNQIEKYSTYPTKFFLSTARGALRLLARAVRINKDSEVLLPSYLCKEIIEPFRAEQLNINFYKINETLNVDIDDVIQKICGNTRALLFINYFGFPQPAINEIKKICKDKIFLIEDLVQSFLTEYKRNTLGFIGDATISSYRKWVPIPDGALLGINNNLLQIDTAQVLPSQKLYVETRLHALKLKGAYLDGAKIPKKSYLNLFSSAEKMLYSAPTDMSDFSRKLLAKFDFEGIIRQRRKNFRYLLNFLDDLNFTKPLYHDLPDGVCPLGFPIVAEDRNSLKKLLVKNKIYPPIHWQLLNSINKMEFPVSWDISNHILTLPVDQRYGKKEMQLIVDIINKFEEKV